MIDTIIRIGVVVVAAAISFFVSTSFIREEIDRRFSTNTKERPVSSICDICGERVQVFTVPVDRLDVDPKSFGITVKYQVRVLDSVGNWMGWNNETKMAYRETVDICDDCRTLHWKEPT